MRYPIVIHKDKHSDFGVIVPDIPGCYSAGSTYDEALTIDLYTKNHAIRNRSSFLAEAALSYMESHK